MVLKRIIRAAVVLLLTVVTVGAGAAAPAAAAPKPTYFINEAKLPFAGITGIETDRYWGVHSGAGYRIEVPRNWNGRLVMWAHGYRGETPELTVDNHPLRAFLIANGYAWAASSYSKNAYDVAVGVQDTHALTQRFTGIVGKPSRVYLTGASMGGHVTAAAIEQYPNAYDAAMPICGVLGDHELFDVFLDYNLVAAALADVDTTFPPDPVRWTTVTVPAITSTLASAWPNGLTTDGENLKALTELRSGGERPLFDAAWVFWATFLFQFGTGDGTLPRSPGVVVDNTETVYQFDTDPALSPAEQELNEAVVRVASDPSGIVPRGLANVPVVNGTPRVPVLTLHDLGDLFVPFSMEQVYAQRVAAAGRSDLLVQRAIRGVGHCDFTPTELVTGFTDLVRWVEQGVRPAGDDVLTPAVVADPAYGCRFTTAAPHRTPFLAACQ
ncbi:MAG TPA: phthalyl amidase [Micromonosporaceae bacterium]|nr:phthalyl amidase [Micromonosporaceae bacterium]